MIIVSILPKHVILCHFVLIHDQFLDVQEFQFWIGDPLPPNYWFDVCHHCSNVVQHRMRSPFWVVGKGIHAVRSVVLRGANRQDIGRFPARHGGTPDSWMAWNGKCHEHLDDDWGYPDFMTPPFENILLSVSTGVRCWTSRPYSLTTTIPNWFEAC